MKVNIAVSILEKTAAQLEAEARTLRRRADELKCEDQKRKELAEKFRSIDPDADAKKIAREMLLPIGTVRQWQSYKKKEAQRKEKDIRAGEISRLHKAGYCKAEIGRILKVSRRTVNRSLSATRPHPIELLAEQSETTLPD